MMYINLPFDCLKLLHGHSNYRSQTFLCLWSFIKLQYTNCFFSNILLQNLISLKNNEFETIKSKLINAQATKMSIFRVHPVLTLTSKDLYKKRHVSGHLVTFFSESLFVKSQDEESSSSYTYPCSHRTITQSTFYFFSL